jgi:hypothetical protein
MKKAVQGSSCTHSMLLAYQPEDWKKKGKSVMKTSAVQADMHTPVPVVILATQFKRKVSQYTQDRKNATLNLHSRSVETQSACSLKSVE